MKLFEIKPSKTEEAAVLAFIKTTLEPRFGKLRIYDIENHRHTEMHRHWAVDCSVTEANVDSDKIKLALLYSQGDSSIAYQKLIDDMPPLNKNMSIFVDSAEDGALSDLAGDNEELRAKIAARRGSRFVVQLLFNLAG